MLRFAFDERGIPDQSGLMMAWAGVDAMYKKRLEALELCLDYTVPEVLVQAWPTGIAGYDGGIAVVQSGADVFVWIGPGTGVPDYLGWVVSYIFQQLGNVLPFNAISPGVAVSAVVSLDAAAWINTLWAGYLLDIKGQVAAAVNRARGPGGRVQVAGFSLGAALATLFGRFLAQDPTMIVDTVGFGQPRSIAEGYAAVAGAMRSFRVTNQGDPVDLVPTTSMIVPTGAATPQLPTPSAWANFGTRFVVTSNGILTAEVDPPSPVPATLVIELQFKILLHLNGLYTGAISGFYSLESKGGGEGRVADNFQNMAFAVDAGKPFNVEPSVVFRPVPPKARVGNQAELITPFSNNVVMPPVWGKDP